MLVKLTRATTSKGSEAFFLKSSESENLKRCSFSNKILTIKIRSISLLAAEEITFPF